MPKGIYDREAAGLKKPEAKRSKKGRLLTWQDGIRCCIEGRKQYLDVVDRLTTDLMTRTDAVHEAARRWLLETAGGPIYDIYQIAAQALERGATTSDQQPTGRLRAGNEHISPDAIAYGWHPEWNTDVGAWEFENPLTDKVFIPLQPDYEHKRAIFPSVLERDNIRITKEDYFKQDPRKVRMIDRMYWEGYVIDADTGRPVYDPPTKRALDDGSIKGKLVTPQEGAPVARAGRLKRTIKWVVRGGKNVPIIDWAGEFIEVWSDLIDYITGNVDDIGKALSEARDSCEECLKWSRLPQPKNKVALTAKQWMYTRPGGLPVNKFDGKLPTAAQLDERQVKRYIRDRTLRLYADLLADPDPDFSILRHAERQHRGITEDAIAEWEKKWDAKIGPDYRKVRENE